MNPQHTSKVKETLQTLKKSLQLGKQSSTVNLEPFEDFLMLSFDLFLYLPDHADQTPFQEPSRGLIVKNKHFASKHFKDLNVQTYLGLIPFELTQISENLKKDVCRAKDRLRVQEEEKLQRMKCQEQKYAQRLIKNNKLQRAMKAYSQSQRRGSQALFSQ